MPRCSRCFEYVHQGENPNVYLNPHTGEAHRCDPGELRVPSGKWRGYKFKDMARLWAHKKEADQLGKEYDPTG